MEEAYHRYVFDTEQRTFVGQFEEMYKAENVDGYDSWHERDVRMLRKQLSLTILEQYTFSSVLDVGCGKGTLTHLMKTRNNHVLGVDGSPTAISTACALYPDIDFQCLDVSMVADINERFELGVIMALLAYCEKWPQVLAAVASKVDWLYVSEYVPPDAIGFVKDWRDLEAQFRVVAEPITTLLLDGETWMAMGRVRQTDGS